jgi:hypothetical protein
MKHYCIITNTMKMVFVAGVLLSMIVSADTLPYPVVDTGQIL